MSLYANPPRNFKRINRNRNKLTLAAKRRNELRALANRPCRLRKLALPDGSKATMCLTHQGFLEYLTYNIVPRCA